MKTITEQLVQRELIDLKKGAIHKINLLNDYQPGAKRLRLTAVMMYGEIADKGRIGLSALSKEREWGIEGEIQACKSCTSVYRLEIKKKPQEIVSELVVGVSATMLVLLMVEVVC